MKLGKVLLARSIKDYRRLPRSMCRSVLEVLAAKPVDKTLASPPDKRARADQWFPHNIDKVMPQITPGLACPLADVLSGAGKRIEELVHNDISNKEHFGF